MSARDLAGFRAAIGAIAVIDDPQIVKLRSRDFYWYSPILKMELRDKTAELIVAPKSEAEVVAVAAAAARHGVPLTPRGAGTGNYGQAMPLAGGAVIDLSAMTGIAWQKPGAIRCGPGLKLIDLEAATLPQRWEMRFHPSTRRTATIGGFICGGSSGVGAINYGILRDRGNVLGLRVITLEPEPRAIELRGDDVQKVVHAYGTNGIVTEVEIALAPAWPWVEAIVAFPAFMEAARFAQALGEADAIVKKLITPVEWGAAQYFKPLRPHLPEGQSIVITMIAAPSLETFRDLVAAQGGRIVFERAHAAEGDAVPPLYEFTWNHTTLQALKVDRSITYLQTLFPPPTHLEKVEEMHRHFGDEVPMHLEFVRLGGKVACFGLQLVRYTTRERLAEIIRYHEDRGCPVFNPHTYLLEDGGMKVVDQAQLAFKHETDPLGLLNPGKMRGWLEASKWARTGS